MRFMSRTFHLACALLLATVATPLHAAKADRILIVVSGEGRDQGKTRPGYEFDELSQAWLIFQANGFAIDVASPQGGAVEADRYDPQQPFNAALLADTEATRMLAATRRTDQVKAEDYAAIYVVGGKGAMFDLPRDTALTTLLGDAYARGAVIGAVCHGPAALAEVRLRDGTPLVQGKALTGFTNEEEAVFGKRWVKEFPWLLEDRMRARGAQWQEAPLMMAKVVVDGRLVTGQNPYSTPGVADAIIRATGRTPVARTPWRDELTMGLAAQVRAGDVGAAIVQPSMRCRRALASAMSGLPASTCRTSDLACSRSPRRRCASAAPSLNSGCGMYGNASGISCRAWRTSSSRVAACAW